jgi:NAD(P)H-hydrate epimerase
MKILTTPQTREADAYTIANEPIPSIDLMERAATQLFNYINTHYPNREFAIFAGPGNNGGDALALARLLSATNAVITVYDVHFSENRSTDYNINYQRLKGETNVPLVKIETIDAFPKLTPETIIVDGIFGSGLSRPVAGLAGDIIKKINASPNFTIAIDIPSGLFGEDNSTNDFTTILKADLTLAIHFPKLSFFLADSGPFVGKWETVNIGLHAGFIDSVDTPFFALSQDFIASLQKKRSPFSHKGDFGHGLLISGSYGKMGATVLSSKAAMRSGLGLLTVQIPTTGYTILQTAVPEAMVSIDPYDKIISKTLSYSNFSAIGIGPGIGTNIKTATVLLNALKAEQPKVIDADGLNILSQHQDAYEKLNETTILTPHPKEFERLAGASSSPYDRLMKAQSFAQTYQCTLVLKDHHTVIATSDGKLYFNTTGNAGMATAGSGDVLTGIILGLLTQGYSTTNAAILGVYLHGLAGDFAAVDFGQEALNAGDIIQYLPKAFKTF